MSAMPESSRRLLAALDNARHLMAHDEATFKRGYTLDNAVLAVTDLHKLTPDEANSVRRMLEKAMA